MELTEAVGRFCLDEQGKRGVEMGKGTHPLFLLGKNFGGYRGFVLIGFGFFCLGEIETKGFLAAWNAERRE